MKNITLITAILFMSLQYGQAQLKLGLIGGYSVGVSSLDNVELGNAAGKKIREVSFVEQNSAPSIGLVLSKDFGPLFASGEVQYRKSGYTMNITNYLGIDVPTETIEISSNTIQVAVTGGIKIDRLRIGVGPVFNLRTSSLPTMTDEMFTIREHKLQTAFAVSLAYDVSDNVRLGVRYEHALSRVGDEYKYRGKRLPIDSRLSYMTLTAGYFF